MAAKLRYFIQLFFYQFILLTHGIMCQKRDLESEGRTAIILTSYPKRFGILQKTLKSLLHQNINSDIYLVLYERDIQEYEKKVSKNKCLDKIKIISSKKDTKSYKKITQLRKIPSDYKYYLICDDDVYYPPWFAQRLITTLKTQACEVSCGLSHEYFVGQKQVHWKKYTVGHLPENAIMNGVAGIAFSECVKRVIEKKSDQRFVELCPNNDDLWISLVLMKNLRKYSINKGLYFNWIFNDPDALYQKNSRGRIDQELKQLLLNV